MTEESKTPVWFWIIGTVALVWNALGLGAYFQQIMMSAEQFAALPQVQQDLLSTQPIWVSAAFAIAVFAGFAAAIALLMRKRIAVRLFLLSLLAVLVQFSSYFILDGYSEFVAGQGWTMPVLIVAFALGFVLFSLRAEKNGLLR
ncbi:hypothetical protein [Sphingorhabdus sp. YGSMI21]|uniref:hypothetical protein n=1 Tax=Sphingorhabdus sp. YGSMI21 TaxID=2077182 RepID=UPI000C1F4934|nr:hypothetical protein [Sphingorhabdus sp. YGSMI21]ATW04906.1 hypothetical protein CHN51_16240 [Sphingorhabdus sp. YGSMI21]